jgi:hypothetical protein
MVCLGFAAMRRINDGRIPPLSMLARSSNPGQMFLALVANTENK